MCHLTLLPVHSLSSVLTVEKSVPSPAIIPSCCSELLPLWNQKPNKTLPSTSCFEHSILYSYRTVTNVETNRGEGKVGVEMGGEGGEGKERRT